MRRSKGKADSPLTSGSQPDLDGHRRRLRPYDRDRTQRGQPKGTPYTRDGLLSDCRIDTHDVQKPGERRDWRFIYFLVCSQSLIRPVLVS